MEIQRIQIKRKTGETIDTNTYIRTFNTHKIHKEIKIGYQKINVEPDMPNPLRCYKCQRFGYHQDQCIRPPVSGRCGEYDMHNNCQKDYKCANCQGNHGAGSRDCEVWKKEKEITKLKHTQKYHLPRSKKDGRDYKICGSDKKKYPNKQKTKLLYV